MAKEVFDFRSAIELMKSIPGEMVETDVEVDPSAELAGVYRHGFTTVGELKNIGCKFARKFSIVYMQKSL